MSKFRTAAFGAVVFLGVAVSAGAQTPATTDSARGVKEGGPRRERVEGMRKKRMERGRRMGGDHVMAQLNLTDAQKTQVRAIHEKYQPQKRTLREEGMTQMRSLRAARQAGDTSAAARQRFQQQREQFRTRSAAIRQQQQNEVRAILTAEQRAKVDAAREAQAKRMEERARQMQERAKQLRSR
ncbi:MAG: Spy/CpxP family protein refolding chaperone [Gemmatimonadaceae bacterium]